MAKIFISYVQEDSEIASKIAEGLEQTGYTTWYYERDSLPGHSYVNQILAVIDQAEAVVVILSPATLGSSQVNIEISEAHSAGKPFAPLLHNLTYSTLHSRQRPWTAMFGTAVAALIPQDGAGAILPRLVRGLGALGVEPDGDAAKPAPLPDPLPAPRPVPRRNDPILPPPAPIPPLAAGGGGSAAIVLGYVFAALTLVVLPIVFAPIGVGFGIYNVAKGRTRHGVAQIILSVVLGMLSTVIAAMLI